MKLSSKDLSKSYTKHLDSIPLNFSFNSLPTSFSMNAADMNPLNPLYTSLSSYGVGYGVGAGPLKVGDIINGDQLTMYNAGYPYKNNTISLSGITSGLTSGLTSALSSLNQNANTVKIYSNSELTVNIVGTEADVTKAMKILDKMYSDHKAEIATL